jgi:hypothetical protein
MAGSMFAFFGNMVVSGQDHVLMVLMPASLPSTRSTLTLVSKLREEIVIGSTVWRLNRH